MDKTTWPFHPATGLMTNKVQSSFSHSSLRLSALEPDGSFNKRIYCVICSDYQP